MAEADHARSDVGPASGAGRRFLSKRHRALLFRASGGICALCGGDLDHSFHADHATPWSSSRTTNVHEMQALCPPCNLAKGAGMLRKHQVHADQLARDPTCGVVFKKVIAAVTPGGGKSSLPPIFAHRLKARAAIDRVLWVAPRDSLREQAERAFLDPFLRGILGHEL